MLGFLYTGGCKMSPRRGLFIANICCIECKIRKKVARLSLCSTLYVQSAGCELFRGIGHVWSFLRIRPVDRVN